MRRRAFNDSGRVIARLFTHPLAIYDDPAGGDKPAGDKPVGDKPAGDKPADGDKPAEKTTLLGDKPEGDKPAGDKPAGDKPADEKPKGLEKYDIKLPDKSILKPDILERTAATARELGLPDNASAQKVVDLINETVASHVQSMTEAVQPGGEEWTKNVNEWEAAALADKEIGGTQEALQATAKRAQRVLKTFFPASVAQMLHNTGFGSHPDVLRAFVKIAKVIGEDKLVVIDAPADTKKPSVEDKFYSESTSKKEKVS